MPTPVKTKVVKSDSSGSGTVVKKVRLVKGDESYAEIPKASESGGTYAGGANVPSAETVTSGVEKPPPPPPPVKEPVTDIDNKGGDATPAEPEIVRKAGKKVGGEKEKKKLSLDEFSAILDDMEGRMNVLVDRIEKISKNAERLKISDDKDAILMNRLKIFSRVERMGKEKIFLEGLKIETDDPEELSSLYENLEARLRFELENLKPIRHFAIMKLAEAREKEEEEINKLKNNYKKSKEKMAVIEKLSEKYTNTDKSENLLRELETVLDRKLVDEPVKKPAASNATGARVVTNKSDKSVSSFSVPSTNTASVKTPLSAPQSGELSEHVLSPPKREPPSSSETSEVSMPPPKEATPPVKSRDTEVVITCPKCKTPITVTDPTRPLKIKCPTCGATGTLKK